MRKVILSYLRNSIRQESFYVDILSILLGLTIVVLSVIALIEGDKANLKITFLLALILCVINIYKGFRLKTPTRYIYAVCAGLLAGASVYSYFAL